MFGFELCTDVVIAVVTICAGIEKHSTQEPCCWLVTWIQLFTDSDFVTFAVKELSCWAINPVLEIGVSCWFFESSGTSVASSVFQTACNEKIIQDKTKLCVGAMVSIKVQILNSFATPHSHWNFIIYSVIKSFRSIHSWMVCNVRSNCSFAASFRLIIESQCFSLIRKF